MKIPSRFVRTRRLVKHIANLTTSYSPNALDWEFKNRILRFCGLSRLSNKGVVVGLGFQCLDGLEENITIEDYAAIGINCHVYNFNEVRFGKFCMLAPDIIIANGGHDISTFEPMSGPLSIGNGCWIGAGSKLVGNISIGDNAVVAAGSLVVHDVPANAIVAGVPARVIKQRPVSERVWHYDGVYFSPTTFELV